MARGSGGSKMKNVSFIAMLVPIVFSIVLIIANRIGQPPASLKPKIFVLGLSKTGTTSIGDALGMLGYRRLGWRDIRSRHMVHAMMSSDHSSLVEQTNYYDAFEDLPWPLLYEEMAHMYPDAKFILSLRKDEMTWLRSMRVHVGRGKWQPYNYFYGADEVEGNEEIILDSYRNHTASVRRFFRNQPERYLEVNIDDGDMNWLALCQVAQCGPNGTMPATSFPKSNTAASWKTGAVREATQWLWGWIVTRTEEQTSFYYYERGWPILNWFLSTCWQIFTVFEHAVVELYYVLGYGDDLLMNFANAGPECRGLPPKMYGELAC